jgi:hypothetical protein
MGRQIETKALRHEKPEDKDMRKIKLAALIAALVAAVSANASGQLGADQNAAPNGNISVSIGSYHTIPEPPTIIVGALLLLPLGASALRILRRTSKT